MDLLPWMERWHMLPPEGGVILCAVSGGRDSVCLLHYLTTIAPRRGFTVAAAHLNHRMRPEAQRDEDFVRGLCREWNVPFYTEAAPVYEMAARWGLGVEETGRRLRYDFLLRTADAIGAAYIATAHHAQDQAETVLLNLLRGTGPQGLAGIPPVRGSIIRPLLETSRQEIEEYLEENGIPHVEDETNSDRSMTRNRLRLDIMPLLKELYPGAEGSICRTAEILRREEEYWQAQADAVLPPDGAELDRESLLRLPYALRLRVLRALTERTQAGRKDFGAVHYEAMEALLHGCGGSISLPGGLTAVCRGEKFILETAKKAPPGAALTLGTNRWGEFTITCRVEGRDYLPGTNEMALGCDVMKRPLFVQTCRAGDGLKLPGSRGRRSVKRLCADWGIGPGERDTLPAFYVGESLAAVWPLGVDEEFQPRETDGEKIIIQIKREIAGGYSNG